METMRWRILSWASPAMRMLLKGVFYYLKPLFLDEEERLSKVLDQQGFHSAICAHPSIIFGERFSNNKTTFFVRPLVFFLKKCIRLGLLTDEKGHMLLQELGISLFWGNNVSLWFNDRNAPIVPYMIPNKPKPKGRVAVYTALTGGYDKVNEILYKEEGVDYFLFTNNPSLRSNSWAVIPVDSDLDNVMLSRDIKMLPNKYLDEEYDVSIYIDANAVIYGEITQLTRYLGEGKSFAVSRHSVRKTVKEEIDACVRLGKIDGERANEQYERYLNEGFKKDQPLMECGILVRKHKDQNLQRLMQTWFNEFKNGIRRDQLSLPPCISRLGFNDYVVMDGSVWHNQFNRLVSHKRK